MDYCQCGSLSSYIYNGNELTEAELREVASCLVLGLVYLHSKHVFHRVSTGEWNECIGYQTIELSDIQQWLDSTGWFWFVRPIEPFLVKKNGSSRHTTVLGTWSLFGRRKERGRTEEWHMGIGHYTDWIGRTKRTISWFGERSSVIQDHSWWAAWTLFIEMDAWLCRLRQQVFDEGWECSMEGNTTNRCTFFIVE